MIAKNIVDNSGTRNNSTCNVNNSATKFLDPYKFQIKNPEFLPCVMFIDKSTDIKLYRLVEKIIKGDIDNKRMFEYKSKLKNLGPCKFTDFLRCYFNPPQYNETPETSNRRKNIKDNMIENYVIRNNLGENYLKQLNIKLLIKSVNSKNIIIKDGSIITITD